MNLSKLNIIIFYHFPHGEVNDNVSREAIVDALRPQSFLYRKAMQSDEGAVKATRAQFKKARGAIQGYLSRFFVHHACVTALLRSMTFGSRGTSCGSNGRAVLCTLWSYAL